MLLGALCYVKDAHLLCLDRIVLGESNIDLVCGAYNLAFIVPQYYTRRFSNIFNVRNLQCYESLICGKRERERCNESSNITRRSSNISNVKLYNVMAV